MQPRCSPCKQDKVLLGCAWHKKSWTNALWSLALLSCHWSILVCKARQGKGLAKTTTVPFFPWVALSLRSEYLWIRQAPQFLRPAPKRTQTTAIRQGSDGDPMGIWNDCYRRITRYYKPLLWYLWWGTHGNTESCFCLLLMQRLPNILIRAMLKWRKPNPTTMGRAGVEKPRL